MRNEIHHLRLGVVIRRQQDKGAVINSEFTADDEMNTNLLRGLVCLENTGNGTVVGERGGSVSEFRRPHYQFLGVRGAAQEGVVAEAVQLGVVQLHEGLSRRRWGCCRQGLDFQGWKSRADRDVAFCVPWR